MNVCLTFEVLLYLNSYYFGLFAICEIGMNVVKAINQPLPNFTIDFGVLLAVCVLELIRVVIARRGNLTEKCMFIFNYHIIILLHVKSIFPKLSVF